MKNSKLYNLLEELKNINLAGKVGYVVAKNRKLIEDEIEILESTLKQREEFKKYEEERIKLAKKYSKKDENNEPVSKDGYFVIENKEEFNKEFELLKEKNKEVLKTRENQIEEYKKLLEEESELNLYRLDEKDIPETATAKEVYTLLKLIYK